MNKLLIFIGTTVGGTVGWWLGEPMGLMPAFLLSGLGTVIGVYTGWKIACDYF